MSVRSFRVLLALVLLTTWAASAPIARAARSGDVERLQQLIKEQLADLDALHGESGSEQRARIERIWIRAGALVRQAAGDQDVGSVACALAPGMDADLYADTMKDLFWDIRGQLAELSTVEDAAQATRLRDLSAATDRRLVAIRELGFNSGRSVPTGTMKRLPDSASEGAVLVRSYCTQCHGTPTPAIHSAKEWESVLMKMDTHAGLGNMMEPQSVHALTPRSLTIITGYLRANACDVR